MSSDMKGDDMLAFDKAGYDLIEVAIECLDRAGVSGDAQETIRLIIKNDISFQRRIEILTNPKVVGTLPFPEVEQ